MAVRTFAELREAIRGYVGDRTDDDSITLIEDINDTLSDDNDYEKKYRENDAAWRKRYINRFYSGEDEGIVDQIQYQTEDYAEDEPQEDEKTTFEELFEEG